MPRPSPLDEPRSAAFAWSRWKRMMRLVAAFTVLTVTGILAYFRATQPDATIHFYIAIALGAGLSILLAGALMSLMFLSNGTGHDDSVTNPFDDRAD